MCGIAGAFGLNAAAIDSMVAAMSHRGPDDSGVFRSASCLLGMARLAIVDTSSGGHQPMIWGDGAVVLVFNGEIFNHRALRSELEDKGRRFASMSDTEVVLQLYLEIGEAAIDRLRGMFAIAILDRRDGPGRERLLLARDHLGIKPLLIARIGAGLLFGSEIKAMLASGLVEPRVNPEAVRQLLVRGAVCQPATMLIGVEMLMPGHKMRITAGRITCERFWTLGSVRRPEIVRADYPEQVEAVRAELRRIVVEQMIADVPLGAFLSGGLDSSLLVAMMSATATEPVRTFSVGFGEDGNDLDESDDSLLVARYLGTRHERLEIGAEAVLEGLASFVNALDQPSVDGLNAWVVSGIAARDVKVAISGTGGDELFAGYPWFRTMQEYAERSMTPLGEAAECATAWIAERSPMLGTRVAAFAPRGFVFHFADQYRHFDPEAVGRLLGRSAGSVAAADLLDTMRADRLPGGNALDRTSGLCLGGYTQNQLLRDIDATSMAHSLEVRVPFLDPDLADLALSLPMSSRAGPIDPSFPAESYRSLGTKRILMDIAAGCLPAELATRPKRGFSLPLDKWLRGQLRPVLEDTVRRPPAALDGILHHGQASHVVDRFLAGGIHWGRPWLLLILCLWSDNLHLMKAAGGKDGASPALGKAQPFHA